MPARIETFYYQAFVEAEGRGGTYHGVIRNEDGTMSDPKTPTQMDKAGFPLSAIFADIDMQLVLATDAAIERATKAEKRAELDRAAVQGSDEILQKVASMLSPEGRELIAREIVALNAKLAEMADPVKVSPIPGTPAEKAKP